MKRSLATALVVPALLIGVLSGCGANTTQAEPKEATKPAAAPKETTAPVKKEPEPRPVLEVTNAIPAGWPTFEESRLTYGAPPHFAHDLDIEGSTGDYHGVDKAFWENLVDGNGHMVHEAIWVDYHDANVDKFTKPDAYIEEGQFEFTVPGAVIASVYYDTVPADPNGINIEHFAGRAAVKISDTEVATVQFLFQDPASGPDRVKELLGTLAVK